METSGGVARNTAAMLSSRTASGVQGMVFGLRAPLAEMLGARIAAMLHQHGLGI